MSILVIFRSWDKQGCFIATDAIVHIPHTPLLRLKNTFFDKVFYVACRSVDRHLTAFGPVLHCQFSIVAVQIYVKNLVLSFCKCHIGVILPKGGFLQNA